LLSKISEIAVRKAKHLWEEIYFDSNFNPFIDYTCDLLGVPKEKSFHSFSDQFPLSKLQPLVEIEPFQPPERTRELKLKDVNAKSQVG
jgi:hypothetical protein